MSVNIVIAGNTAAEAISEILSMASALKGGAGTVTEAVETKAETPKAEKPAKEKKAKEEKAVEASKVEVLPPEKPKYVLQDAVDHVRKAIGDKDTPGHEENCIKLKKLNQSFGIERLTMLPAEKVDSYMAEAQKTFPASAKTEAPDSSSMF